jgi:hypothetical protein
MIVGFVLPESPRAVQNLIGSPGSILLEAGQGSRQWEFFLSSRNDKGALRLFQSNRRYPIALTQKRMYMIRHDAVGQDRASVGIGENKTGSDKFGDFPACKPGVSACVCMQSLVKPVRIGFAALHEAGVLLAAVGKALQPVFSEFLLLSQSSDH